MLKIVLEKHQIKFLEINGQKNDYNKILDIKIKAKIVLLIQYQAGSTGLNLEKFNRMIFFSPSTSAGNYKQAIKRIHRIGQEYPCFYYQLITSNSVEENIFKSNQMGIDYTLKMFVKEYKIANKRVKDFYKNKLLLKKEKSIEMKKMNKLHMKKEK